MMPTAETGTRSFYLDEFVDEFLPCETTLEGWAAWLASEPERNGDGIAEFGRDAPAEDGAVFEGNAILWQEDIVATRNGGNWSLSREPADDEFVAVRFVQGSGWSPDNIVQCGFRPDLTMVENDTMAAALLAFLSDDEQECSDIEYVAVGSVEMGWRFTFRSGPPAVLEAERVH